MANEINIVATLNATELEAALQAISESIANLGAQIEAASTAFTAAFDTMARAAAGAAESTTAVEETATAATTAATTLGEVVTALDDGFGALGAQLTTVIERLTAIADSAAAIVGPMQAMSDAIVAAGGAAGGTAGSIGTLTGALGATQTFLENNTRALGENSAALGANTGAVNGLKDIIADGLAPAMEGLARIIAVNAQTLAQLDDQLYATTVGIDELITALRANTEATVSNTLATGENTTALEAFTAANAAANAEGRAGTPARAGGYGAVLGATMILGMVTAVDMLGVGLLKQGMAAETALGQTYALTDGFYKGDVATDQYTKRLMDLAAQTGKPLTDLAHGLYDIASVDFGGAKQNFEVLTASAKAAAAGGVDLHTVTNGLTSVMKVFGVESTDANTAVGILTEGIIQGKAPFDQFSRAIGLVGEAAHSGGVSLQESVAALAALSVVWPTVRQAGSNLQATLLELTVNYDKLAKNATKLGLAFDENAYANIPGLTGKLDYLYRLVGGNRQEFDKLVGAVNVGKTAWALMTDQAGKFAEALTAMNAQNDTTSQMLKAFDDRTKLTSFSLSQLGAILQNVAFELAEAFKPSVTSAIAPIAGAIQHMVDVVASSKAAFETFKQAAIALALVLGAMTAGAAARLATVLAGPLKESLAEVMQFAGWTLVLIGAFFALKALYEHSVQVRQALNDLASAIGTLAHDLLPALGRGAHGVATGLQELGQWFVDLFGTTKKVREPFVAFHGDVSAAYVTFRRASEAVTGFRDATVQIAGPLTPLLDKIHQLADFVRDVASKIQTALPHLLALRDAFAKSDELDAVVGLIQRLGGALGAIIGAIGTVASATRDWWEHNRDLHAALALIWSQIQTIIPQIKSQFAPVIQQLRDEFKTMGPTLQEVGRLLKEIGPIIVGVVVVAILLLVEDIKLFVAVMAILYSATSGIIGGFVKVLVGAFTLVADLITGVVTVISDLVHGKWGQAWTDAKKMFGDVWQDILSILSGLWDAIWSVLRLGVGAVLPFWQGIWSAISSFFVGVWNGIVSTVKEKWTAITTAIHNALEGIATFFRDKWNGLVGVVGGALTKIHDVVVSIITAVKNFIVSGFNLVRDVVGAVVGFLVGAFLLLYNHNYYFKALVDGIVAHFQRLWKDAQTIWNAIVAGVKFWVEYIHDYALIKWAELVALTSAAWNALKVVAIATWTAISDFLGGVWDKIKGAAALVWNGLVTAARSAFELLFIIFVGGAMLIVGVAMWLWDKISGGAKVAWDTFVYFFKAGIAAALSVLHDILDSGIVRAMENIATTLYNSGKKFIQMLAQGIRDSIGVVVSAAADAAGAIGRFLGFHSPTEEGPGATADRWAPNLVRMFAQGLESGQGPLGQSAAKLALAVQRGMAGASGVGGALTSTGVPAALLAGGGGGGGATSITLNLQGGLGAGLQLLNPTDRQRFAQQIAQEMAQHGQFQAPSKVGYSGH